MYKFLMVAISIALPLSLSAKTVEEILASGSAEEIGLAIAVESDERDLGFGDSQVDLQMTLYNANGQKSIKKMRNKIFEIIDTSVGDKTLIVFDKPRDVKGTAFLTFSKILQSDDQWLYLPALKRVKRISSKNKSGPFVGSEFAFEDISSQEVGKYSYKYLRNEPCGKFDCFVTERYPNYQYSGYTKMVAWTDTTNFQLRKVNFYDRKEALLKTLTYNDYKQYLGKYWRADQFLMVNHQNGKSTDLRWENYKFRTGLKESDLTKSKLKNTK